RTRLNARTRDSDPRIARCDTGTPDAARSHRELGAGARRRRFGRSIERLDTAGHSRHRSAAYAAVRSRSTTESAGFVLHSRRGNGVRAAIWFGRRLASETRGFKRCAETGGARLHRKRARKSSVGTPGAPSCATEYVA